MKLTDPEWAVMEVLWSGERFSLGEITKRLQEVNGWNRKTVYTYLTRMEGKGLVEIAHGTPEPYAAALSREECAREERREFLHKVYGGATGDLIAAFLKENRISREEAERLRRLLDEMEV